MRQEVAIPGITHQLEPPEPLTPERQFLDGNDQSIMKTARLSNAMVAVYHVDKPEQPQAISLLSNVSCAAVVDERVAGRCLNKQFSCFVKADIVNRNRQKLP
jgi:hypothetical protein